MLRLRIGLAIIFLLPILGCSSSINGSDEKTNDIYSGSVYFTGTINEITGNTALVYGKLGSTEGNVYVDLSVNKVDKFQVGDKINVEYDGIILESHPAKINTLSVELME
ncbi:DUF3221 domain-containing protein [Virgibacillus salexigens]|uniref:DUF3221 domain-containing protein n=1 Tax=Virgibacillus salexigens TaxID=61016 RepID=UPI00190AD728|nr:DUF3221 domain-containing protein [Virgibacillus salexigens]